MNAEMIAHLAGRAQRGDKSVFNNLFTLFYARLVGFIRSIAGENSRRDGSYDAEDVAQDTFAAAWESIGDLRNPTAFRSWLFTIARRTTANYERKSRNRITESTDPFELDNAIHPEWMNSTGDVRIEAIQDALAKLPEKFSRTFMLYYVEEWTTREIAEAEGISEKTVSWRVHEARKRVRKMTGFNV